MAIAHPAVAVKLLLQITKNEIDFFTWTLGCLKCRYLFFCTQFLFVSKSVKDTNGSWTLEILIHTFPLGIRSGAGVVFPYQTLCSQWIRNKYAGGLWRWSKVNWDFCMHITTSNTVGTQKEKKGRPPRTWSNKLLISRFAVADHGLL